MRSQLIAVLLVAFVLAGCATPAEVANDRPVPVPAATSMTGHVTGRWPTDCHARQAADGQPLPGPDVHARGWRRPR